MAESAFFELLLESIFESMLLFTIFILWVQILGIHKIIESK